MIEAALHGVGSRLAEASVGGALVALGAWAACACTPRLPAAVLKAVWWLVCVKLLLGLAGFDPVRLPLLPASPAGPGTADAARQLPGADQAATGPHPSGMSWHTAFATLWLAGFLIASHRAAAQWRRVRAIRRGARRADGGVTSLVHELSRRVGLSAPPAVRFSEAIDAPMVAGAIGPEIILPSRRWRSLDPSERAMAVCHELVHLRRADLWLGVVPGLVERIFFFHPLAHLAAREYLVAREAACDAAVLRVLDAEPQAYGRLLVTLGVAPTPGLLSASGASPSFSGLKRRLHMLDHRAPTVAGRLAAGIVVGAALLALVPLTLVERSEAAVANPVGQDPPAAPQAQTPATELDDTLVLGEQGAIVARQSAIGTQQAEVGAGQAAVGAQQAEVGAQQAAIGARLGRLRAPQAGTVTEAEQQRLEREHAQLDDQMRSLSETMAELNTQMRALADTRIAIGTATPVK